ncbi:hypothetical protein [Actinomadura sediminis]|uniref:Uncharacterized protein n=1 Tax=Actinomadura sediminis TaxID=1038904 RepID=A0ABW3EPS7_9ACTN
MSHDLKDLREVMESHSAAGSVAPDLHERLRRRIRRGRRARLAAGAAGAAVAAGAVVPVVWSPGAEPAEERAPVLAGAPNDAFTSSPPKYGMKPLKEVQFSAIGRKAQVSYTPTGTHTMIEYRCSTPSKVYAVSSDGALSGGGCDENGSVESYRRNDKGAATVRYQAVVVPPDVELRSAAELDRYVESHSSAPGRWSVRVYGGTCELDSCYGPPKAGKRLPVKGMDRLAQGTGPADGRPRMVRFRPTGESVRVRVTCVDGAAVAVVSSGGRPTMARCEADENLGLVWDHPVTPGESAKLKIAVLPAGAGVPASTDEADIEKAMAEADPAGTWKVEIFSG